MGFFDLTKTETNINTETLTLENGLNRIDDFLLGCEVSDFNNTISDINKEFTLLCKVNDGCYKLESDIKEGLNFESALKDFEECLVGTGFTLESFGLDNSLTVESALLTMESANGDSLWKKVWEWIKKKIAAISEWFTSKWNLIFSKTKKEEAILDKLMEEAKELHNVATGASKKIRDAGKKLDKVQAEQKENDKTLDESIKTMEKLNKSKSKVTSESALNGEKLYFREISNIKGAAIYANMEKYLYGREKFTPSLKEAEKLINSVVAMVKSPDNNKYEDVVKTIQNGLNILNTKIIDPNRNFVGGNFNKNMLIPLTTEITTENKINFQYIAYNAGADSLSRMYVLNVTSASINVNYSENSGLPLLSADKLVKSCEKLKTLYKYVNSSDFQKDLVSFNNTIKALEAHIPNHKDGEGLTGAQVRDIVQFLLMFTRHTLASAALSGDSLLGILRILAVHIKKQQK